MNTPLSPEVFDQLATMFDRRTPPELAAQITGVHPGQVSALWKAWQYDETPWANPKHDIMADIREMHRRAAEAWPPEPYRPLLPGHMREDIDAIGMTPHVDFTDDIRRKVDELLMEEMKRVAAEIEAAAKPDRWLAIVHPSYRLTAALVLLFRGEHVERIDTSQHVNPGEIYLINLTQLPDWATPPDLGDTT